MAGNLPTPQAHTKALDQDGAPRAEAAKARNKPYDTVADTVIRSFQTLFRAWGEPTKTLAKLRGKSNRRAARGLWQETPASCNSCQNCLTACSNQESAMPARHLLDKIGRRCESSKSALATLGTRRESPTVVAMTLQALRTFIKRALIVPCPQYQRAKMDILTSSSRMSLQILSKRGWSNEGCGA